MTAGAFGCTRNYGWDGPFNSSYYSAVVFTWKRGIWVIVLKRKCLCIKYPNVLAILSYFWLVRWGITPTKVARWDGRTYRGISNAVSIAFLIWQGQAPLNIWTCCSLEKYVLGGMFPHTICLSSLLSLFIMTQMPHFHALSHRNRWTASSTVIIAIVTHCKSILVGWHNSYWNRIWTLTVINVILQI